MDETVAVGRLIRARGNRGELVGEIYSSQPGRAEKLKQVTLDAAGRTRQVEIEQVWYHDGRPVFKFAGIDSISEAEQWAGADIVVAPDQRIDPGEGEYSHAGLIGCRLIGNIDRAPLGAVVGVEDYGGTPLLKVKLADGQEALIPFARSICREIDIPAKTIRVELPDGLLEL